MRNTEIQEKIDLINVVFEEFWHLLQTAELDENLVSSEDLPEVEFSELHQAFWSLLTDRLNLITAEVDIPDEKVSDIKEALISLVRADNDMVDSLLIAIRDLLHPEEALLAEEVPAAEVFAAEVLAEEVPAAEASKPHFNIDLVASWFLACKHGITAALNNPKFFAEFMITRPRAEQIEFLELNKRFKGLLGENRALTYLKALTGRSKHEAAWNEKSALCNSDLIPLYRFLYKNEDILGFLTENLGQIIKYAQAFEAFERKHIIDEWLFTRENIDFLLNINRYKPLLKNAIGEAQTEFFIQSSFISALHAIPQNGLKLKDVRDSALKRDPQILSFFLTHQRPLNGCLSSVPHFDCTQPEAAGAAALRSSETPHSVTAVEAALAGVSFFAPSPKKNDGVAWDPVTHSFSRQSD